MIKTRFFALLLALLCVLQLVACGEVEKEPMVKSYFEYFDTVCTIYSYADESEDEFRENCRSIEEIFEKYDKELDIYYEYSGVNNLCTVNKKAGGGEVKVSPELIDFLVYAKEIYAVTGGKTNIAMGSVLRLWHDARGVAQDEPERAYVPSIEELSAAAEHTNIEDLLLNTGELTVSFADPALKLDVGALGKGYVANLCAKELEEKGITSYVLDVGGNIRAIGTRPNGNGWKTGITNPDKSSSESFSARIWLSDTSCVTSGNYERYFELDGKRYHHIIDPITLMPSEYFASVSIICRDSALADALSTALFCMPYEDGLALVSTLEDVEVLWVYADGTKKMTDGFSEILVKE